MATGWRNEYTRYKEFYLNIVNVYKQRADLRAFLEIILSLSTIIIFIIFALKPTALTIINLVREIEEKKVVLQNLAKKIEDIETAGNIYFENQELISKVNLAISNLPEPESFSQQVLATANKNTVQVMGMSVGQVQIMGDKSSGKPKSDFKPLPENSSEMPFSISVRGDYAQLISFIKDLEDLRLTTKIDMLGVNSANTEDGTIITSIVSGRIPYINN